MSKGNGVLFKNDKGDNPNRPDYRGDVTVEGIKYTLASWVRKDKKGRPYMSIEVTEYNPKAGNKPDILEDDIPF